MLNRYYRFTPLSRLLTFAKALVLLALLLTLPLWLYYTANLQTAPSHIQHVIQSGTIRIGTLASPTNYYERNLEKSGFEYELAQQFAQSLHLDLHITTAVDIRQLWELLDQGKVDFLAAGIDITANRQQHARFAPAYNYIDQKLIYKQGAQERPRNWAQVQGHIKVLSNSSHEEILQQLASLYPHLQWSSTHLYDSDELLDQVINEEIDFTIVDSNHLDIKRRQYPELSIAFTIRERIPVAWAFSPQQDDSLYAAAIEFIGQQHDSGFITVLQDRYFGHVKQFNYVDTQSFIQAVQQDLPHFIHLFKKYASDFDWKLLAAMSYQESHWNPRARSSTGVRGMMMLTLPTAKHLGVASRLDPEQSIRGGAKYLEQLKNRLPASITDPDRTWLALAAYNVGLGHLNDARIITENQGGNPNYWLDVRERLPLLRQKQFYRHTQYGYARGDEPVQYVGNIRRYYDTLIWLEEQGYFASPLAAPQGTEKH